jgi:hypothetical protein
VRDGFGVWVLGAMILHFVSGSFLVDMPRLVMFQHVWFQGYLLGGIYPLTQTPNNR